ncbi:MAG: DUF2723 domain-containing protein, partial [Ferruginibacter sp.]|nr:DUF2723 domain-containing protein [Ferruginibacter sp.]
VVFWAILKWEQAVTDEQAAGIKGKFTKADRWIILIFYLMGLSIGVHLLNLLSLPAIVIVYYFKRYKPTLGGTIIALLAGCIITGFVQKAVIQWSIKLGSSMDVTFVNDMGSPFFLGFGFFFVLLALFLFLIIRIAVKNNLHFLSLGTWSFSFMLLGYLSYLTPLIRSNADTSIDMFNVDNPISLYGYVGREQYGDWPLLYGQDFTARPIAGEEGEDVYVKKSDTYEKVGNKYELVFDKEDKHWFPRMWDMSNDRGQASFYASWANIEQVGNDDYGPVWDRAPTFGENLSYFVGYQLNWMYLRYFMWNFAGKQNDIANGNPSNVRDGNWITGINFLDKIRLGDQQMMPESIKNNKANNKLYMLPLILGLLGWMYQLKRDKKSSLVSTLLFFFTGIAIILYLNQAGNQPRERDYAFVGSFYAFAIWIGLGVLFVNELFSRLIKNSFSTGALAGIVCLFAVPVQMAFVEWDDHDRSQKKITIDLARDYLESCPPNALLVTFGDNDTYPLWYAQEVENVRPDIRVVNYSLLTSDWNINQLTYKLNESAPFNMIWTPEQISSNLKQKYSFTNKQKDVQTDLSAFLKDLANRNTSEYFIRSIKMPVDSIN